MIPKWQTTELRSAPAIFFLCWLALISTPYSAAGETSEKTEMVRGSGCYHFGDDETPAKARRAAMTLAQEDAIRSHRVFVDASTRVKNFQLEEDIVRTASAAFLQEIIIEKEERKPQEICITLSAKLSPGSAEDMIRQRISANEISEQVKSLLVPAQPAFSLKVWTNNDTNRFIENDRLIIYVKADRDAYLKLDYFQADGKVVHLVPNIYRGQAHISGGKIYSFGDDSGPEQFIIKPPYGDETVKAIVSLKPFEFSNEPTEDISESRAYLRSGLRGIKVVAAAAAVSIKTASKTVDEYDQNRPQPKMSGSKPGRIEESKR